MVAVSTIVPVPLNSLIVTPKDHVTKLSQMKGKTVGITGIPSDGAIYQMLLRTTHMTSKQIPSVTVGENLVPSILSGRVDAIVGGYRNVEAIQIAQEMGKKPTVFPASALGVPNYAELVLVANRNRLKSDPAYARRGQELRPRAQRQRRPRRSPIRAGRPRSWRRPPSTRPSSSR